MRSSNKKDSIKKFRELALKKNLKKRKKLQQKNRSKLERTI